MSLVRHAENILLVSTGLHSFDECRRDHVYGVQGAIHCAKSLTYVYIIGDKSPSDAIMLFYKLMRIL